MVAAYPITGSELGSRISTGLSTQIIVKVGNMTVGAIQRLSVAHTRNIERVKEVGTDGVIEAVPNQPTNYEISVTRIVFDKLRLPESFAKGFINIKSQLVPFDIQIMDRTNGTIEDDGTGITPGEGVIVHTLTNCWFSKYTSTYDSGNYIITEEATIVCEDIRTNAGNNESSGSALGTNFQYNPRERATDAGTYRGTLDVDKLITQTFTDEE